MGAKYTATSVSGYNASPPADDGSTSESNKVKWATIKTKLPDPIKTALESIDTKLTAWVDYGPVSVAEATTIAASHNEKFVEVTSACTMTLTDASTLTAGWMTYIVNASGGSVTIARATGGDTIDGSAANITLPTTEAIGLVVNAAGNGFLSFTRKGGTPSDNTVTAAKIVNDTITEDKLAPGATLQLGTMQASTSGTAIDFTVPAGTKMFVLSGIGVSVNGVEELLVQLGDAGGVENSGYVGGSMTTTGATLVSWSAGVQLGIGGAATDVQSFQLHAVLVDAATFLWSFSFSLVGTDSGPYMRYGVGYKSLSAELTTVRLTTTNTPDTFDAGNINIAYK